MVAKPEDYRWSGCGEAVGGGRRAALAREGPERALDEALRDAGFRHDWARTLERYRVLLYDEGRAVAGDEQLGEAGRLGMVSEEVDAVVNSGGKMSRGEALRHRVRYFCDGAVLGSAEFVDRVFEREKAKGGRFGGKRKTGARRMRGAEWGGLRVLRDLRKDVMGK